MLGRIRAPLQLAVGVFARHVDPQRRDVVQHLVPCLRLLRYARVGIQTLRNAEIVEMHGSRFTHGRHFAKAVPEPFEQSAFIKAFIGNLKGVSSVEVFDDGGFTVLTVCQRVRRGKLGKTRRVSVRVRQIAVEADHGMIPLRLFKQPPQAVARRRIAVTLERLVDDLHLRIAVVVPEPLPTNQIDDLPYALRHRVDRPYDLQRLLEGDKNLGQSAFKILRFRQIHFHPKCPAVIIIPLHAVSSLS